MKIIKALLIILTVNLSLGAVADDKLRLAAPFFPPYTYFDIDGNLDGIWIKQLSPVMKEAGIDFIAINTPIARFYSSIATGKVQLSALPKDVRGMDNVIYSAAPFASFDMRVYWLADRPDISSVSELANQRVVLTRGYNYGGFLEEALSAEQRANFVTANNKQEAISLLVKGEADYILGYWALMDYIQKNKPELQLNNKKVTEIPIYLVIHNSAPGAEEAIAKYNAALAKSL